MQYIWRDVGETLFHFAESEKIGKSNKKKFRRLNSLKGYRYILFVPVEKHLSSHRDGYIIVSVLMDVLISRGIVVMKWVCFRNRCPISYYVPNLTFLILPCRFCFVDQHPTNITVPSSLPTILTKSPYQEEKENKIYKKRIKKERKGISHHGSCSDSGRQTVKHLVHIHL